MKDLSHDEARRLALWAQGFYDPIPARATRAALRKTLDRIALFQMDSVNVLVRSHYLPLFSRVGPYPPGLLRESAWGPRSKRTLFEYWAHEASLIPLELRPLFAWRMESARLGRGTWGRVGAMRKRKKFVASVLRRIEEGGPATASSFEDARGTGSWWGWSDVKVALEYLFWSGELTTATRTTSFERVYDLPERVFSDAVLSAPRVSDDEAFRRLLMLALEAMGVATEADLRDYFRLELSDARGTLRALVDEGTIEPVGVQGWKQKAYVLPGTRVPRRDPPRSALLSPFDSLIWNRDRAHRLFEFHYRIEIYTPAHKRVHGYYVLPLLHGGRLIGRADLKADRERGALQVKGEHYEAGADARDAREALTGQLEALATFLDLTSIDRAKTRA